MEACGNATRCVAYFIGTNLKKKNVIVQTLAGLLICQILNEKMVEVEMYVSLKKENRLIRKRNWRKWIDFNLVFRGKPSMVWNEIPLSKEQNTMALDLELSENGRVIVSKPVALSVVSFFIKRIMNSSFA